MSSVFDEDAKYTIELAKKYGRNIKDDPIALAVDALVMDISDRRGLKQEWANIDEVIQQEITCMWDTIIRQCINS